MASKFMTLVNGIRTLVEAITTSSGAGDAGKIIATDSSGTIDPSLLPAGIGPAIQVVEASEALSAGNFVNLYNSSGLKARLADNSNGRPAHGFVLEAVSSSANASVYPLGDVNAELTSLTVGARYYLGTAGAVTATALDPDTDTGKVHQYLGTAYSATELKTEFDDHVVL